MKSILLPKTTSKGFVLNGKVALGAKIHSNTSLFDMFECKSTAFSCLLSLKICVKSGVRSSFSVHFDIASD